MYLIEFKICVIAGNGNRVVVSHQIFFVKKIVVHKRKTMLIKIVGRLRGLFF